MPDQVKNIFANFQCCEEMNVLHSLIRRKAVAEIQWGSSVLKSHGEDCLAAEQVTDSGSRWFGMLV